MPLLSSHDSAAGGGEWVRRDYVPPPMQRANRRRLYVFLGTLIAALAIGLAITWLRPAEYRATARVAITPVSTTSQPGVPAAPVVDAAQPFLTEMQVLTSRPVIELAATKLEAAGYPLAAAGADPVAELQSRLEATQVPNTSIVELAAKGPQPETLSALVNTIIDAYRERQAATYRDSSAESMAQASDEVKKLEESIAAKRREVEAFRQKHRIVSGERDENQVLSQVRTLSASLGSANERVAKADGKLKALTDAAAGGGVAAKDDPAVAALEQRAGTMRDELKQLERDFTPSYLAKDPRVIAMRDRLAEVDRQIVVQRLAAQQNAIAAAREDVASARNASTQIEGQIAAARADASQFNARFSEYKAQQDQLAALETTLQEASKRQVKLEATEGSRTPTIKLLEAATTPQQPWRPLYWRDTVIVIAAALLLALLAMWLVELFNRTEPQPTLVVVQPAPPAVVPYGPALEAPRWAGAAALAADAPPPLLAQPFAFPRELSPSEASALVEAADEEARVAVLLLFAGLSLDEALALRPDDVDAAAGAVRVRGASARELVLAEPLRRALAGRPDAAETVLGTANRPATQDTVRAQIVSAAHDAAIDGAIDVTPACLRHTYVAYLVRQGIRFAELQRYAGQMSAQELGAYSTLSPRGARIAAGTVDPQFPPSGAAA